MQYTAVIQKSLLLTSIIGLGFLVACTHQPPPAAQDQGETTPNNASQDELKIEDALQNEQNNFFPPLDNAQSRITKKPFGIFISPDSSPVQPERFRGYHTGTDFEVAPEELNRTIPVLAICSGTIKVKRLASGYGGIMIQSCQLPSEEIQVLYGHIDISARPDVQPEVYIEAGQEIAILGDDQSKFTDGERKHLHLGIYRGQPMDLRGYVSSEAELNEWLNPAELLWP